MKTEAVLNVLQHLQNQICWALEQQEGATQFVSDEWQSALGVGQSRVLKHAGFEAGLIPNGDTLVPDGDTLVPSAGVNGQFEYTINGTTYAASNSQLPLYRYIVVLKNSSFAVYEYLAGGVV